MTVYVILLSVSFLLIFTILLFAVIYRGKGITRRFPESRYPMVSILKPVKNLEDGLRENLITFFEQDYPDFEIIFGVDHISDPVYPLIKSLVSEYPAVRAKIVETGFCKCVNPKIHKLAELEKSCSGELYWVADSNIRVENYTLLKLAGEYLENDSRLIFSPIRGTGTNSFGSAVENSYINQTMGGSIIASWKIFRQQLVVGKSILIEKKTLDVFGGFMYFSRYLGEDFMMGRAYSKSGFKISTNITWVTNYSSHASIGRFLSRMSRWAKIRFTISPALYIAEILSFPVVIASSSLIALGSRGLPLLGISIVLKLLAEYIILFTVNPEDSRKPYVIIGYPVITLCKEFLLAGVYLVPFISRTAKWKGRKMKITRWSEIEAI